MDKLWMKLLVIGLIVSLAWSAALSWAVFSGPSEQTPLTTPARTRATERALSDRNAQIDRLIADATRQIKDNIIATSMASFTR